MSPESLLVAYIFLGFLWFPIRQRLLFDARYNQNPNVSLTFLGFIKNLVLGPFILLGILIGVLAILCFVGMIYFLGFYYDFGSEEA